jgi:hypothetical protein
MKTPLPEGIQDIKTMEPLLKQMDSVPVVQVADKTELQKFMNSQEPKVEAKIFKPEEQIIDFDNATEEQKAEAEKILKESAELLNQVNHTGDSTQVALCPYCNWDQRNKDIVAVSDEDKQMWLRHIISGDRFIKRYSLFGGAAILEFRSRLVAEQDMIMDQLNMDVKNGVISSQSDWIQTYPRYALAASLARLITGEQSKPFASIVDSASEDSIKVGSATKNFLGLTAQKLFSTWNDTLFSAAVSCIQQFDLLCARLQTLARDENFFKITSGERS